MSQENTSTVIAHYRIEGCLVGNSSFDGGEVAFLNSFINFIAFDCHGTSTSVLNVNYLTLITFRILKAKNRIRLELPFNFIKEWSELNGFNVESSQTDSVVIYMELSQKDMSHFISEVAPILSENHARARSASKFSLPNTSINTELHTQKVGEDKSQNQNSVLSNQKLSNFSQEENNLKNDDQRSNSTAVVDNSFVSSVSPSKANEKQSENKSFSNLSHIIESNEEDFPVSVQNNSKKSSQKNKECESTPPSSCKPQAAINEFDDIEALASRDFTDSSIKKRSKQKNLSTKNKENSLKSCINENRQSKSAKLDNSINSKRPSLKRERENDLGAAFDSVSTKTRSKSRLNDALNSLISIPKKIIPKKTSEELELEAMLSRGLEGDILDDFLIRAQQLVKRRKAEKKLHEANTIPVEITRISNTLIEAYFDESRQHRDDFFESYQKKISSFSSYIEDLKRDKEKMISSFQESINFFNNSITNLSDGLTKLGEKLHRDRSLWNAVDSADNEKVKDALQSKIKMLCFNKI